MGGTSLDYVLSASALPTGGRRLGRCAPCERRRRQLHRSSRLVREEERGLGELELEQTRLPCVVADQVDARVKELPVGQRREGAVRHGTLVGPGLAPGDRLGREQPVGRQSPQRQQRPLADGVTEAAVDVDERSLPVLIDALEVGLQEDRAMCVEELTHVETALIYINGRFSHAI